MYLVEEVTLFHPKLFFPHVKILPWWAELAGRKNLAFWRIGQLTDKYKYRSGSVWTMFSGTWGDFWACPVQGQKLDSVIFEGPFQLRSFYDFRSTSLFCMRACVCVAVAHCGCSWAPHNLHWHWGTHVLPPSPPAFPELCESRCWILYLWQLDACNGMQTTNWAEYDVLKVPMLNTFQAFC